MGGTYYTCTIITLQDGKNVVCMCVHEHMWVLLYHRSLSDDEIHIHTCTPNQNVLQTSSQSPSDKEHNTVVSLKS